MENTYTQDQDIEAERFAFTNILSGSQGYFVILFPTIQVSIAVGSDF